MTQQATGTIDERGRLVLPRAWREALELSPGDRVVMETDGVAIRVVNARRDRAALAARLRGAAPTAPTVDELIADRRADARADAP